MPFCSDELRNLVELCGGSTVQDPALFSFEPHQKQLIIVEPTGNFNLPVLRSKLCFQLLDEYLHKSYH